MIQKVCNVGRIDLWDVRTPECAFPVVAIGLCEDGWRALVVHADGRIRPMGGRLHISPSGWPPDTMAMETPIAGEDEEETS
jgi:hypothetical protein